MYSTTRPNLLIHFHAFHSVEGGHRAWSAHSKLEEKWPSGFFGCGVLQLSAINWLSSGRLPDIIESEKQGTRSMAAQFHSHVADCPPMSFELVCCTSVEK